MNASEHLEMHLGRMERGWSSGSLPDVQVCLFRDQPAPGVVTLATLGLSNQVLTMNLDREVRQELLLTIRSDRQPEEFAKLLLHVAEQVQIGGRALLRGTIIPLGARVAEDSASTALYASMPVVFRDELATLKDSSPPTVFVWLFPIMPGEAAFVDASGWGEFEDLLEAAEPDLFDLCRDSIVDGTRSRTRSA